MKRKPTFSIISMVLFVCLAGSPISSSAGGSDYYVLINGEQKGPMATEQLENLKQDGTLTSDTLVWKDGMAEWGKAGEQEDLKTLFAAATPPPPPPPTPSTPPPPPTPGSEGQPAGSDETDEGEAISEASEPDDFDPADLVEEDIREYRQKKQFGPEKLSINSLIKKKGGWIGDAIGDVNQSPESPSWGNSRVMAFGKAFDECKSEYLLTQYRIIKAENESNFTKAASGVVPDFKEEDVGDPDKLAELFDKLVGLADAKLNQKLDELGVDKEQFKRVPKPQRHRLFSESIKKKTIVEAIGKVSGLVLLQSFEGFNKDKDHIIGAVCIATPNLKQFAHDILHARGQLQPSKKTGVDLYEKFSQDDTKLIDEFGVRKMIDEEGYPVLISFGQWAVSKKTDNKKLMRKYKKAAKKLAANLASDQVAVFLAGESIYQSNSDVEETFEEAYKVDQENYKEPDMVNDVLDGIKESTKEKAQAGVSGLTELYDWSAKYPKPEGSAFEYGQEIVGVILKWSPRDEQDARKLKDWKPGTDDEEPSDEPKMDAAGASGTRAGELLMDEDDF